MASVVVGRNELRPYRVHHHDPVEMATFAIGASVNTRRRGAIHRALIQWPGERPGMRGIAGVTLALMGVGLILTG